MPRKRTIPDHALLDAALLIVRAAGPDALTFAALAPRGPHGVVDLLVQLTGQYDAHDYADQLRLLREDLRDPVLRARGQAWLAALTRAVDDRLGQAPGGAAGLGALTVAYWQGTLTVWGFTRQAPVVTVVKTALEEFLNRLMTNPQGSRAR